MNLSNQRVLMLLGLSGAVALAIWWIATHHRQMVLERTIPKPLVSDPWAASRQFLTSMGMKPRKSVQLDEILDKADSHDVMILDIAGRAPDQSQLQRLLRWVRGGGHLVVDINRGESLTDCLLASWGLRFADSSRTSERAECDESSAEEWKDESHRHWSSPSRARSDDELDDEEPDTVEATVEATQEASTPDSGIPAARSWRTIRSSDPDSTPGTDSLRRSVSPAWRSTYLVETFLRDTLTWSDEPPREAFRDPGGFVLIGRMGNGSIAVVQGFGPFKYDELARWDHASLLWRLVEPSFEGRQAWIAHRARVEGWLSILADRLGLALALAFAVLGLSMWTAASRFGPILLSQPEEKTGIVHHAEGAGRWLWQLPGGRLALLAALQNSARRTQLRTHPELVGADPKALGRALEAEGLGNAAALEQAFEPAGETSPRHFLSIAKTLWSLRRNR